MAGHDDNIPDQLKKIREDGGSVHVDGENVTANSDTETGALGIFKHFNLNDAFYQEIRDKIREAVEDGKNRRGVNALGNQTHIMPVHPRVFIDTELKDVSLDWHHCRNKKCCAPD
jgi:hypothetical protein